jgi:hypothetical protein
MMTEPVFHLWWREFNKALKFLGTHEADQGDARYWYDAQLSPETAARLLTKERAMEVVKQMKRGDYTGFVKFITELHRVG